MVFMGTALAARCRRNRRGEQRLGSPAQRFRPSRHLIDEADQIGSFLGGFR
jgi:hypothetical protein